MKKAVYRLILFAAVTAFALPVSPSVKADPNDTSTKQNQDIARDTKPLANAEEQESAPHDVDNLKWAIKIILGLVTAFVGFAFASMGVILFKNKKDYEHALADAKEAARDAKDAAKNARDLEKEAQGVLAQAKTKLEEIDTKAKETMADIKAEAKAEQEEIEKKGNEERQKSLEEAGRQRKISELFSKGLTAGEAKDYETAADYYRQIVEDLKTENNPFAYNNWGTSLLRLGVLKKGTEAEELFKLALEKYQKATEIKQGLSETHLGWGCALANLSEHKERKEAEELLNQATGKYQKAIQLKPDNFDAYVSWANAFLRLARLKGTKDAENVLKQAEEKCLKAESIKTGEGAYNLGCVYARRDNEDKCKEWLKVGEKAGTLPAREHAMADDDLESVRDKAWFEKLRWKGE